MNLPNKLTLIRILLVPFFVIVLLIPVPIPHRYLIAGLLFGIAAYTDSLDGRIARKQGLVTNFGKFLDPLADKIMVISILICFIKLGCAPAWCVILIVFREFMVTSIRLVAIESGYVIAANKWGKAKTVSQIVAIITIMLWQYILELTDMQLLPSILKSEQVLRGAGMVCNVVLIVATILTTISGIIYVMENREVLTASK